MNSSSLPCTHCRYSFLSLETYLLTDTSCFHRPHLLNLVQLFTECYCKRHRLNGQRGHKLQGWWRCLQEGRSEGKRFTRTFWRSVRADEGRNVCEHDRKTEAVVFSCITADIITLTILTPAYGNLASSAQRVTVLELCDCDGPDWCLSRLTSNHEKYTLDSLALDFNLEAGFRYWPAQKQQWWWFHWAGCRR